MVDQQWLLFLNGLPAHIHGVAALASLFARRVIFLYPLLLIWLWFRRRPGRLAHSARGDTRRRVLLLAVVAAVLALIVNIAVSRAVARPRPYHVLPVHVLIPTPGRDTSFPSDHAAVAGAVAVALWLGGESAWGPLAFLGAVLIGVARVVAGVHYPSDILGGLVVGAVCAAAALRAHNGLRPLLDAVIWAATRLHLA